MLCLLRKGSCGKYDRVFYQLPVFVAKYHRCQLWTVIGVYHLELASVELNDIVHHDKYAAALQNLVCVRLLVFVARHGSQNPSPNQTTFPAALILRCPIPSLSILHTQSCCPLYTEWLTAVESLVLYLIIWPYGDFS